MDEMMKLVIGWTIVGGFVFTVLVTCLSLVGWIRFADRKQQQKLFYVLIVEVVVGLGAKAAGGASYDTKDAKKEQQQHGSNIAFEEVIADLVGAAQRGEVSIDKAQLERLSERIQAKPGEAAAQRKDALRGLIHSLPEGRISTEAARTLSTSSVLTRSHSVDPGAAARIAPHQ